MDRLGGGANFKTFFSQYLNLKEFQHRIIDHVHQKTSSPAVRDLVSNETLQIFLTNGPSRTIPATFEKAPGAFELSAAPLLLQRVLPMPTQPQLEALGFISENTPYPGNYFLAHLNPCRIDSLGPYGAGTLYAGDGVVIQSSLNSTGFPTDCIATLRYPYSSFAYGNMTFLWSRVESAATSPNANLFEPDARAAHGQSDPNESPYYVEYGRININFTSSGQLFHYYAPQHVVLDENSVFFNIVLRSTENPVTLYAVRRLKIESYQTDFSIDITPMQPNVHRGTPASHGFFANKHKPVDFSCAEIDRSSVTSGTRSVLTVVYSGTFDSTSSMMTYYTPGYDLQGPAPSQPPVCSVEHASVPHSNQSLPQCSDYYRLALYRQHTNSTAFRDFSTYAGKGFLISNPGYYVGCVSAQEYQVTGNARLQRLDGFVTSRFENKGTKDRGVCSSHAAE